MEQAHSLPASPRKSVILILGFFPTRLRKDWPLQSWTQRTTSLSEGGETERSAFGWKLAAVSLEGEKGPGAGCSNPTARNASSPGWRGGRGGRRGTGSRARRSCSRGSTCCTRSCARPRGSCIGRRSSWTAAASATAATAGSPRRRRTRRRRPAVARHEHTFNPTSPLKPIKNQETEQLNNNNQPVNYHGASALQPERGRVIDGHLAAGEPRRPNAGQKGEGGPEERPSRGSTLPGPRVWSLCRQGKRRKVLESSRQVN